MKTALVPVSALALIFASCENPADATTDAEVQDAVEPSTETTEGARYVFTDDSTISFVGSKVTGSHDGGFKEFTGNFVINESQDVTGGQFVIDMDSTWSDAEKLTGHLKSEDFFDVPNHPETTFVVTSVEKKSDSEYTVAGNLTLRGVEKNVTFPAAVSKDGETVNISAEFDINRKDWNIVYAGKADDLIRDEVVIKLDLTATPEA